MRVYDVFPFFNELALLELRMDELAPVVDVFGAVELPVTFRCEPKPMHLAGRTDLRVYTPPAHPTGFHPTIDWFQRRELAHLFHDADPTDIIIFGDVDEIPSREVVRRIIRAGITEPLTLMMDLYYHRVDLKDPVAWPGTIIAPRYSFGDEPDMQKMRDSRGRFATIPYGGWHFSWLGPPEQIRAKLRAVDIERESLIYGSDGILEPDRSDAFLQACYDGKQELFSRGRRVKEEVAIEPGVLQPHGVVSWLERHPEYARQA